MFSFSGFTFWFWICYLTHCFEILGHLTNIFRLFKISFKKGNIKPYFLWVKWFSSRAKVFSSISFNLQWWQLHICWPHMVSMLNVSHCSFQLSFKPTFYTFICISPQQVFMVNVIVISKKIVYNYFTSTFVTVLMNTYMFSVHVVLTSAANPHCIHSYLPWITVWCLLSWVINTFLNLYIHLHISAASLHGKFYCD